MDRRMLYLISMDNQPIANDRSCREAAVMAKFLETPSEDSFSDLFHIFRPQLVAFFRARGCDLASAEDLTQEVLFTVYRKAEQVRDRASFRAWLFKIARNALCQYFGKQSREVETVELDDVGERQAVAADRAAGTPAFEFKHWLAMLDSNEREVMSLRFIEEWEYHEIAAAKSIPIGTVQWRVFNAKKKLAPHLISRHALTVNLAA
jgi:RNA polymerase sigma factor (sigma-70 family)